MSTPGRDGAPPLPGATVADAAAGGMQAALAITAALAGRATTGRGAYLDVSVAEGVLWLMSLADRRAAGARWRHPARARRPLGPLRLLRHLRRRPTASGWPSGPSRPSSSPTSALRSGCPELAASQLDDDGPAGHPGRLRRRLRHPDPRRVGRGAGRRRHLRGARPRGVRGAPITRSSPPGGVGGGGVASDGGRVRAAGAAAGRHGRGPARPVPLPDMAQTDTEHLLKEAGVDGETVARWVARKVVA